MDDKIKAVHKIIDLAESAFRRPTRNGLSNLKKALDKLDEAPFKFLCKIYDVGAHYSVQPDNAKKYWEVEQSNINDIPLQRLKSRIIPIIEKDQIFEVRLVRGLGILQQGGVLENTGVK